MIKTKKLSIKDLPHSNFRNGNNLEKYHKSKTINYSYEDNSFNINDNKIEIHDDKIIKGEHLHKLPTLKKIVNRKKGSNNNISTINNKENIIRKVETNKNKGLSTSKEDKKLEEDKKAKFKEQNEESDSERKKFEPKLLEESIKKRSLEEEELEQKKIEEENLGLNSSNDKDNNIKEKQISSNQNIRSQDYNNVLIKYIYEGKKNKNQEKLNKTTDINNQNFRFSTINLEERNAFRNTLIYKDKNINDNLYSTYRKPQKEKFINKLQRDNSDNITYNKKKEMERNLNKNIHSTNNSRIKNKSNFFEKKTYNNKSKQEK